MGPEALAQVLRPLAEMFPAGSFPDVLRGLAAPDDAAVYRLDDERALVVTADFFPPVVDDPYDFGSIAAANALSDLYAMGATPLLALNLVGFPEDMPGSVLAEILRGGADKVREAGAVVAGGHSTTDHEPKYGLAAIGTVHPDRVTRKSGAKAGDVVVLTKPIGTGLVTTALKRRKVEAADLEAAVASMKRLSAGAARLLHDAGTAVHAVTDVTGFGLAGHGREMAEQSEAALRIRLADVPALPGAERYAREGMKPGGAGRNARYYGAAASIREGLDPVRLELLWDPQTSGGLLAAVDPASADALLERFRAAGEPAWTVGTFVEGRPGGLEIV